MLNVRMQLDGFDLLDPAELYEQVEAADGDTSKFWGRANSYRVQNGRHPGIGWVLVSKLTLESIPAFASNEIDKPLLSPLHTLTISDGNRTVVVDKLSIIKAEAIHGNNPTDGNTAFLLTLTDARHFAKDTVADTDFGLVKYDGSIDEATPQAALAASFDGLVGLMGSLNIADNVSGFDVEEVTPLGGSAWDGFWSIVDSFGLQFTLRNNGRPYLFCLPEEEDDRISNQNLQGQATGFLMDWADHQIPPYLPETISLNVRKRDYQWWKEDGRHTPQDHHRAFKSYSKDYEVTADASRIVLGTTRSLWAPFSLTYDDRGLPVDQGDLDAKLDLYYDQYITCLLDDETWLEKEYTGAWPFEATDLTAVRWADFGDGLTTKIWEAPGEFPPSFKDNVRSWEQPLLTPGPPSFARDTLPHARTAYGLVLGTPSASPGTTGSFYDPIEPNKSGKVIVQYGQVPIVTGDDEIVWQGEEEVTAWNVTGTTITPGTRAYLRFNFQLGTHGEWVIVVANVTEPHFIGIVKKKINKADPFGDLNPNIITPLTLPRNPDAGISGAPGGSAGFGPNIRLVTLNSQGRYEWLLDATGEYVEVYALNTCFVDAEAEDIAQGKLYQGSWWIDVLCCPSS